jgi:arylformamidase
MTKLIDISRMISPSAAVYEGDDPLGSETICDVGAEAPCRITSLVNWTTHFLTHVDAPRHFIVEGPTLDEIPLSRFRGPAVVVDLGTADAASASHVPDEDLAGISVLFKSRNSSLDPAVFHEDHVYVSREAADVLVAKGANLIGIDYLSVDRFGDEDYPAHRTALGAGVLILEGLDLSSVEPGRYTLFAYPMKIASGDGSPVRAVLETLA